MMLSSTSVVPRHVHYGVVSKSVVLNANLASLHWIHLIFILKISGVLHLNRKVGVQGWRPYKHQ